MHHLLTESLEDWRKETVYSQPSDWVFASRKLKDKQPRVALLRPQPVGGKILAALGAEETIIPLGQ
jgi:hypothetical protein